MGDIGNEQSPVVAVLAFDANTGASYSRHILVVNSDVDAIGSGGDQATALRSVPVKVVDESPV